MLTRALGLILVAVAMLVLPELVGRLDVSWLPAASFMFLKAKSKFALAQIDWEDDTFRAMPVDAVPDPDLDEFVDDLSGDEVGSVRADCANPAVVEDAANDQIELDCDDFTFSSVPTSNTVVGIVIYKQVGGDDSTEANDPVVCFLDTTDLPTNGGDIDVTVDGEGVAKM